MKAHLRSMAKRKVSDFLLREEGMVGSRTAFATAALVSTTALAMTLLVAPDAKAAWCPGVNCPDPMWCYWNGEQHYFCRGFPVPALKRWRHY